MNLWEGGLKPPVGMYEEAMKFVGCKKGRNSTMQFDL
jgi:hypothetical protein